MLTGGVLGVVLSVAVGAVIFATGAASWGRPEVEGPDFGYSDGLTSSANLAPPPDLSPSATSQSSTPAAATVTVTVSGAAPTTASPVAEPAPGAPGSANGTSPDTRPISLPEHLPGFPSWLSEVEKSNDPAYLDRIRALQEERVPPTIVAYQTAYGGAAVDVALYSKGNQMQPTVIAIRAASPLPTAGIVIPEESEFRSQHEVVKLGEVYCTVTNDDVTKGDDDDPDAIWTSECMRTGAGLTVITTASAKGVQGRDLMAAATDEAWNAVSGP